METEFHEMPAPHRAVGLKYSGPVETAEVPLLQVDPPWPHRYMFLGRDGDDSQGKS